MTVRKSSFFAIAAVLVVIALLDPASISVEAAGNDDMNSLTPNLPFGDINVVVLTDIHSWLGSHRRQEPYNDVDFGDVLSFWQRLKEHCDSNEIDDDDTAVSTNAIRIKTGNGNHDPEPQQKCVDVFFVNNGDFVHGTGLSRVVDDQSDPEYIIPLLEKMPYDLVNVGNHELYNKKNTDYMTRPGGYVDWWGERYLTSNIHKINKPDTDIATTEDRDHRTVTKDPLGNRYKILQGRNSKVLAFGFLYNFKDVDSGAGIGIEKVQTVVTQQWFLDALTEEDYDAILVLAHMDLVDPLVDVIRSAIRDHLGEEKTPIVFLTGHTHYRGFKQLEDSTITFEAGRYMDTVGFVSFPKKDSVIERSGKAVSSLFKHSFLDTNRKFLFEDTLGFSSFEVGQTKDGKALSEFIDRTRKKLGLENEVGCAPRSYYQARHIDAPDSLWGLYRDEVVPKAFLDEKRDDLPPAMLVPSETWRYNLYNSSSLVVDDVYAVAPFNDTIIYLGAFSADAILEANKTLNSHHENIDNDGESVSLSLSWLLPKYILIGDFGLDSAQKYHLYTHDFGVQKIKYTMKKIAPSEEIVSERTEHTSSLIWLAFVQKYWPCDGTPGVLPSESPIYSNAFSPHFSEDDEAIVMKRNLNKLLAEIVFWQIANICVVVASIWILARVTICIFAQRKAIEKDGDFKMEGEDDIECKL